MSIQSILLPVLVQVSLMFVLFGLMASARLRSFKDGLDPQSMALTSQGYPQRAQQYSNAFSNQFEIPVLFLFAVMFAIVLHQAGWLFVALEWLFVAFRLGHAFIHTTSNNVAIRGPVYACSVAVAALLWLLIFIGVFFGTVIG